MILLEVSTNAPSVFINDLHKEKLYVTGVSNQNGFPEFVKNTNIF